MARKQKGEDALLNNVSMSELLPKAVRTVDFEAGGLNIANATKKGYLFCPVGGIFDMSYPNSKLRRGRVQGEGFICPTITCNPDNLLTVVSMTEAEGSVPGNRKVNLRIRKLTERECFRLMGLRDAEIDRLIGSGELSSTALYKMIGNSIVVNVLEGIFENLIFGPDPGSTENGNALF